MGLKGDQLEKVIKCIQQRGRYCSLMTIHKLCKIKTLLELKVCTYTTCIFSSQTDRMNQFQKFITRHEKPNKSSLSTSSLQLC